MTATVTVTVDPTNAPPRMRLDLAGFTGGATISVTRTDSSGNTATVRAFVGMALSGGGATGYDYDAPFNVPVTYTATSDNNVTATSTAATLVADQPWLYHATIPSLSVPLEEMTRNDRTLATGRGLQRPIGRSTAVPTTDGTRYAATFDLVCRTDGLNDGMNMSNLLGDSSPLLLQLAFPDQLRTTYQWIDAGDVNQHDLIDGYPDDPYVEWTLPCTVIDAPVGTIQAQRTLTNLNTDYPTTLQALSSAFATLRDIANNTPIGS
ncbi:hypothetical protein [uncultured Jatrophihabitans sp.]|uniref:hypothetical protein n=1 Tax=uncultured Jatrophihabitans sp. TaxID=1610747 RepID=UPI0035C992DC